MRKTEWIRQRISEGCHPLLARALTKVAEELARRAGETIGGDDWEGVQVEVVRRPKGVNNGDSAS